MDKAEWGIYCHSEKCNLRIAAAAAAANQTMICFSHPALSLLKIANELYIYTNLVFFLAYFTVFFFIWSQLDAHYFFVYLFQILYMTTHITSMWPSSGELNVSMWHLVLVILCGWLPGLLVGMRLIPTSRPDSHTVSSQPADQTAIHTE